jgi:uracil-DNA glycosylase
LVLGCKWCPNCKKSYSKGVITDGLFCPKCGKFLETIVSSHSDLSAIEGNPDSKKSFVRAIYGNMPIVGRPANACDRCFEKYGFSRLNGFNFKPCFPPVGSSVGGQVLFVGLNPRCRLGSDDEDFYRHALASEDTFVQFSEDGKYRTKFGNLKELFSDGHYDIHQQCLREVDSDWKLGKNSSVAELFMCGKENATIFSGIKEPSLECICANEYLCRYMELVRPKVIVSFGSLPLRYFQSKCSIGIKTNTKRFDKSSFSLRNYNGDPLKDSIEKMHSQVAQITLNSGSKPQIIFSLHPSHWMRNEERAQLLQTFSFIAKPLYD